MSFSPDTAENFCTLTEQEKYKILREWNNTTVDYPKNLCIHQLFAAEAEKNSENIAVVFQEEKITYRELNDRSNKLAHYLQSLGVGTEVLVGICLERSWQAIVGLLGILKAGGAYLPLDPTYPQERLSFMLSDSQTQIIITQQKFVEQFIGSGIKVVCLDNDEEIINQQSHDNPNSKVTSENLAYVIYTSGSTGTPKGVAVPHRAVNRLVCNTNYVQLESSDIVAQAANFSFDAATFEIWGALLHGAKLVIIPQNIVLSPQYFASCISEQKISILFLTTALFNQLTSIVPEAFKQLRNVLFGGEAVDVKSVKSVLQNGRPEKLLHVYGPTESTTFACWYLVESIAEDDTNVPIGRPISNTQVYILNSQLQPVPVGVPGEIYIGGDGLTKGYLNRPELTAEKFIITPICQEKLYKTGDLGRFLPDGNIEFLGRIDNQVKIRGFRIELGEIEVLLNQHPDLQQAVVIVREDVPGDKQLVAYIVANKKLDAGNCNLKSFLEKRLPNYMVPAIFVMLDSLPLNANGKIDRQNLPIPNYKNPNQETFVAPRNPIEQKLSPIWTQLLRLEQIGINDNLFDIGGHSLIITQMLSRLRENFQVELDFEQIFQNPTISSIAELIAQNQNTQNWQRPPITKIPRQGLLPVSFAQERVYFIQQLAPENNAYQFQATMRFKGHLDVEILQRCLNEIVQRHEIFRTTYPAENGRLFQIIHPHQPISFTVIDLQKFPESQRETEAQILVEAEIQKPLDMNQLPLIKWVLLKLSKQEHLLIHIEHHLVHDGWSFNVFLDEFLKLYQAFSQGNPSPLNEPALQFVDFANWQREWVKSSEAQAQINYWQQKLSGSSPLLELPLDRPRPTEQTYQGDQIRIELPINLCEDLRIFSRREGVTLFMTMLAAFQVMLHRYSGQDDICIGSAVANRRMQEVEKLIGMIVNNVVLRTDLSGNPTFRELLARVREVTLEAYANEDLPFDQVVDAIKPERNLSYNPLFQVMFSFHNSAMPDLHLPGLDISLHEPISNKSAKFDLDFLVIPRFEQSVQNKAKRKAKGITLVLEYNSDLFDATTIQRMLEQYQVLLTGIIANPEQRISQLPLLTTSEKELLELWNQTEREFNCNQCIHQLFEAQVEKTPDAVAVWNLGEQLTYRELNSRANQLANYLQSLEVKPETLVGICVERSLEMIVGLLAILKAGGAYIPLDPAYPKERITNIIEDTQLSILLTQERFQTKLINYTGKTIFLDKSWSFIAQQSTANPISNVQLNNLAYIIYTSGSTGKPKGVTIEHRSLINFVMTAIQEYGINEYDRVLQFASFCFDASIEEIFPCLTVGATLVLRTEEMLQSSDEFWHCCQEWQLTVLDLPTAYWHQLVDFQIPDFLKKLGILRVVIIGGEEAQLEKVKCWHNSIKHLPQIPQLFNSYGPTEATVITTLQRLNSPTDTFVSIGKPISNVQVYILDKYQQPVPIGVPGELYIGGAGLARGYWQRPELTAEKFITQNSKLYKTGDLARFRRDGSLEYLGRIDDQVKIRGFRIELGEIETVLNQHPQIFQSIVVDREDNVPGQKRLVAYIVPKKPQLKIDELRLFLKEKLPNYMVPAAFVLLDKLPMTGNQKVDYRALPVPDFSHKEDDFVAPRSTIEEKLAAIWSETLKLEKVGINDNFFELGGDSILSIQIISRAKQVGIKFSPKQLFQYQTIAELAAVAGINEEVKVAQGLVTGKVPLTPIQHWFFEQKLTDYNYFNQSVLLEVSPDLQAEFLQQAVQELLVHHDALRLRFVPEGESWQQINLGAEKSVVFSAIDLSHLSSTEQETTIKTTSAELQASLNLSIGPIAKIALFQLNKNQPNLLLFIVHHLAVDGISWRILLEDLATAYQQISSANSRIKLPVKTTSFQDWSDRLTEYTQSETIAKELDYWLNQAKHKFTPLPIDYPSTAKDNTVASTSTVSLSLNEEQTRALLQDVPAIYNTQINDVLLSALMQSFAQWTGESSLILDLEGHGREDLFADVDLSRTVGWFTTIFPVRLQLKNINDPGDSLKLIKEQLRQIPNRGIGYGILRYLPKNDAIREKLAALPQAQVSFNYLGQFDRVLLASAELGKVKEFQTEQSLMNQRSHLLGISGFIRAGILEMTWAYSENIHQRSTIEQLALGFMEALKKLISHCQVKASQNFTPSDFAAARVNQQQLDKFIAKLNKKKNK